MERWQRTTHKLVLADGEEGKENPPLVEDGGGRVAVEVAAVFGLGNVVLRTNEKYHLGLRTKLQPSVGKNSYNGQFLQQDT